MRKIETQMIDAIKGNKNWSSGNTQVVTNMDVSTVYLHGNKIAMIDDTSMTIFDGGYQSVTTKSRLNALCDGGWKSHTTKSRLNALCDEFCIAGEGVFQKDFLWYVRKFVGAINGKSIYQTEDFKSGYVFA